MSNFYLSTYNYPYYIYRDLGFKQEECGRIELVGNEPHIYFSRPLDDDEKNEVYDIIRTWTYENNYDNAKEYKRKYVKKPQYRTYTEHCKGDTYEMDYTEERTVKISDSYYEETLENI